MLKHTTSYIYRDQTIPVHFWERPDPNGPPDTVLFLGTGQVGKLPKWIAQAAPPGVVVVEGLPHWLIERSARDLVVFSTTYTQAAFEAVLGRFDITQLHVLAESQAVPGVIWLGNRLPEAIGNIALALPMGLNTAYFGDTPAARFRELRRRARQTLAQPEQSLLRHPRNWYVAWVLGRIVAGGLLDGSTVNKYTVGISEDMLDEFRTLAQGQAARHHGLILFLGAQDKVFPAHEIVESLSQAHIQVDTVVLSEVSHSSLALKANAPLVRRLVKTVRA